MTLFDWLVILVLIFGGLGFIGRVKRVPVELGDTHGEAVWVLKGLNVGDRIAVEGLVNLRDGAQVRDLGEVKG
jgi:multidrug efflux pump subunit AcrA (membrane-fusion protein)